MQNQAIKPSTIFPNTSARLFRQFEVGAVADLKAKKMTPEEFATKFNALDGKVKVTPAMVPVATDAARTMVEMGDAARAQSVLKPLVETNGVTASSTAYMFIALNYAALAETNGDNDEAIRVLESYTKSGHKVMLAKAYLDLGRLYLAKGDQAKAKTNLDYIVANYPNDELAKLARLYLQKLTATP